MSSRPRRSHASSNFKASKASLNADGDLDDSDDCDYREEDNNPNEEDDDDDYPLRRRKRSRTGRDAEDNLETIGRRQTAKKGQRGGESLPSASTSLIFDTAAAPVTSHASVNANTNVPKSSSTSSKARRSQSTVENIWAFFTRGSIDAGTRTVCDLCEATFSAKTGISNLRYHLRGHQIEKNGLGVQLPTSKPVGGQKQGLTDGVVMGARTSAPFSQAIFLSHLVDLLIADEQSINVIEHPDFRQLLLLLRPDLDNKVTLFRIELGKAIITAWEQYFKTLKEELAAAAGKISFTCYIWSDLNQRSFACLTAHWIASDKMRGVQLRAGLIGLRRVDGHQDGERLAVVVLGLLDRAGVGHFTLDDTEYEYNSTFMGKLESLLKDRGIDFDKQENRAICFPRIINICVSRVMAEVKNAGCAVDSDRFLPTNSVSQTFEEACKRDPIALGRGLVRAIEASGRRRDQLSNIIKEGNETKQFFLPNQTEPVELPEVHLLHDVGTWDSVYMMINRLRTLRPAVKQFLPSPIDEDLSKHRLSDMEWSVLQDYEAILAIPHRALQTISKETTPILSHTITVFEMLMKSWEVLAEKHPRLKGWIDVGLSSASKYYTKMGTTAHLIAMLLNPSVRLSWIRAQWSQEYFDDAINKVKALMIMYHERTAASPDMSAKAKPSNGTWETLAAQYGIPEFDSPVTAAETHKKTVDEEFLAYVTADLSKNINILQFWQLNREIFPTFFAIAMDFLPIQASTVPSEPVFSGSKQTMSAHRKLIAPELMEALQMLKFGLKKATLNFMEGWMTSEEVMRDQEEEDGVDLLAQLFTEKRADTLDILIAKLADGESDREVVVVQE